MVETHAKLHHCDIILRTASEYRTRVIEGSVPVREEGALGIERGELRLEGNFGKYNYNASKKI